HAAVARRVVDEAGLAVDVGPFGTSAEGGADQALAGVARLMRESLAAGATRISLQVNVVGPEGERACTSIRWPTRYGRCWRRWAARPSRRARPARTTCCCGGREPRRWPSGCPAWRAPWTACWPIWSVSS